MGKTDLGGGSAGNIVIKGKAYPFGFASFAQYLVLNDEVSGLVYLYSGCAPGHCSIPVPTEPPTSAAKNSLQLSTLEASTLFPFAWWSPECKPAIYLYPE